MPENPLFKLCVAKLRKSPPVFIYIVGISSSILVRINSFILSYEFQCVFKPPSIANRSFLIICIILSLSRPTFALIKLSEIPTISCATLLRTTSSTYRSVSQSLTISLSETYSLIRFNSCVDCMYSLSTIAVRPSRFSYCFFFHPTLTISSLQLLFEIH